MTFLSSRGTRVAALFLTVAFLFAARPAPAAAISLGPVCSVVGIFSGLLGKGCTVVSDAGSRVIGAAKDLFSGRLGSAIKAILGDAASAAKSHASQVLGLAAIGIWVIGGAKFVLSELANWIGESTTPRLGTTWFSTTYWRVAGIAALLTLPFLFAAAVQALVRSDITLLLRSVLAYLPLALLMVGVAAPITMLLLSASDELSSLVSSAAGHAGSHALGLGGALFGSLSAASKSLFFVTFYGLLVAFGATALWIELVMREAAVYVVVLMLPLAFAALVWPARRIWAIRAVEILVALILSKFAIVAVLSLGGAAMDQLGHSPSTLIVGLVLVIMGAFAPWAVLRLVPLAELASSAAGSLSGEMRGAAVAGKLAGGLALSVSDWASSATRSMGRGAEQAILLDRLGPGDSIDGDTTDGSPNEPDPTSPGSGGGGGTEVEPSFDAKGDQESLAGEIDRLAADGQAVIAAGPVPAARAIRSRQERIPGMPTMWQADNFSWEPIELGPDGDWSPRLGPPDFEAGSQASAGLAEESEPSATLAEGPSSSGQDVLLPSTEPPLAGPAEPPSGHHPTPRPALPALPPPRDPEVDR